jgi:predicted nucleic acid-binding protein
MIVVDASVLTNALAFTDGRGKRARAALLQDPEWAAPEHWKAEVFSALRGLTLGGRLTETSAARAIERLASLVVDQVCLHELLAEMWRLRTTINGYDAAYVALASARGLTLLTSDIRLAKAAISHCRTHFIE